MRPQVVAHRGASHEVAEHTLGAYLAALDAGAEAFECDVRLTADGHLVCVHDRDLRRTASTRGIVSTMDLAELDSLDFASWKNPWADLDDEAPDRDESLDKVLTLRKLLETVADYERPVEIAIETKHPTRYGGLVERRLVEMLRDFGWDRPGSPVRVMSFSFTALQRVQRLAPDVPLVMLIEQGPPLADAAAGDRRRLDRRPGHQGAPRPPGARPAAGRERPRHPRLDRQHRQRPPALPRPRGQGGHHRPTGVRPGAARTDSLPLMGKRSRTKARDHVAAEGEVGPRQPCPCGSGRRYKACHGSAAGRAGGVRRPPVRGPAVGVRRGRAARAGARPRPRR